MFTHRFTMNLKADSHVQLSGKINKSITPLLQSQNGFLNVVTLVNPDYGSVIGDTYWETKSDAEAFQQNGYLKILEMLSEFDSAKPKDFIFEVPASSIYQIGMEKPFLIENKTDLIQRKFV